MAGVSDCAGLSDLLVGSHSIGRKNRSRRLRRSPVPEYDVSTDRISVSILRCDREAPMSGLFSLRIVFCALVLNCVAFGEQAFSQSSPFGLLSDSWSMPAYRTYYGWQPYGDSACCDPLPTAPTCGPNCGEISQKSNFGDKPDSILSPEPDDPGAPPLPPGHNKSCPCGPCKTTAPTTPSSASPITRTYKPVEQTSRRGGSTTAKKESAATFQVVRRRQTAPLAVNRGIANRFPENENWIPVVETKTASR